ncbi:MAG TPA: AmmeMemoRadiSam system radical SAM enzyme [Bacteroidota bacterium]|nr:AmmeMemoRadiSam system radical SAM enzyme [Bacteroidota bacterium]
MPDSIFLKELLAEKTSEGVLYSPMANDWVRCFACGHRCKIAPGKDGICKVRFNREGKLLVPHGYVGSLQIDPIEKKPFFHALPGSRALSFGMLGCDYHCSYCQNWITSQVLRDPEAIATPEQVTPEAFVDLALRKGARVVTSTYNEPLITSEWAVEIFSLAKKAGLVTSYVSNGNGTPEVIDYLQPYLDLYKIDLKGFRQRSYGQLGGVLQNVLDTIKAVHARNIWLEVVTLVVPGFNDSNEELRDIARFLVSVSSDIPWHVTAFHQDYRMTDRDGTGPATLRRAREIGIHEGLSYVYAGNLPGQLSDSENTLCPACGTTLIERFGFAILSNRIQKGSCPNCKTRIAGFWEADQHEPRE